MVKDAYDFAGAVESARLTEIVQPFLSDVAIVEATRSDGSQSLYLARDAAGEYRVLSGNPDALTALVASAETQRLDSADGALVFANLCAVWTADFRFGELRIAGFGDIPFHPATDADRVTIAELQATVAPRIAPARLEAVDGGHRLVYWAVARSRLVHKAITVTAGAIAFAELEGWDVPVPPGRTWGMVGGTLVPTS